MSCVTEVAIRAMALLFSSATIKPIILIAVLVMRITVHLIYLKLGRCVSGDPRKCGCHGNITLTHMPTCRFIFSVDFNGHV